MEDTYGRMAGIKRKLPALLQKLQREVVAFSAGISDFLVEGRPIILFKACGGAAAAASFRTWKA